MRSKFNKNVEFSLNELGEEIANSIYRKDFTWKVETTRADQILFYTDNSRQDLYEAVIGHAKYLGFTTQSLREGKPEFKIPKSTLKFKRDRQIEIKVLPKSGRTYLKSGWENPLIYDLKRYNKLPSNIARTNPDNYEEYEVIKKFNQLVDELCVDVVIGGKVYSSIAGMVPGPAGAKADFVGVDSKGNPKFYISYKEGSTATDFQQYSGITQRGAGAKISSHDEVRQFVESINDKTRNEVLETAYWRKIKDSKLKKYAVFGKDSDAGPSRPGVNNVDFFAQGKLILTSDTRSRRVKVNFSTLLIARNDLYKLTGDYEPTLGTRRGEVSRKVGKHSNVRGGIWSSKYIKDRTSEEI